MARIPKKIARFVLIAAGVYLLQMALLAFTGEPQPALALAIAAALAVIVATFDSVRASRRFNLELTRDWTENPGTQPPLFNVDLIHSNGRMTLYTPTKKHDWSLEKTNPIIRFRKAAD